ncbi:MAG TPA: DUF2335 domain-containing protein [Stellaceae bacterium]|jgi:uncharacterized membrane protein|nr:DUF2335 domain-containing protein [Stellaceae bacterium]
MGTKSENGNNVPPDSKPLAPLSERPEASAARDLLEPLRLEVQEQLSPLLKPDKREQADLVVERLMTTISEKFSGPVAHPAYLDAYERILPGAAERLFVMAEAEQRHRHQGDNRASRFESIYAMTGLSFGFIIGLALVGAGAFVAIAGQTLVGGMFAGASAVGMVSAFIRGRSRSTPTRPGIPAPLKPLEPSHIREIQRTENRQKSRQRARR